MNLSNPTIGAEFPWRVAQKCDGGACVRIGSTGEMIVLGDSKNPGGPVLCYTGAAWKEFVRGVKAGVFDNLV